MQNPECRGKLGLDDVDQRFSLYIYIFSESNDKKEIHNLSCMSQMSHRHFFERTLEETDKKESIPAYIDNIVLFKKVILYSLKNQNGCRFDVKKYCFRVCLVLKFSPGPWL